MRNYVQPGNALTLTAPAGGVTTGVPVLIGAVFGVAAFAALEGEEFTLDTVGVFDLDKVSAQAWATVGLPIYWDDTAKLVTSVATNNTFIGVNVEAAANPSATGKVRLNGVFGIPSGAQITAEIGAAV